MKKFLLAVVVLAMVVAISSPSSAAGKMLIGVGGDVLIPMGDFGDAQSTGFGGSARFQYNVTPMFSAGLMAGYFTWSGKDQTFADFTILGPFGSSTVVAGGTVSGPDFKGVPVRAFGKYYFMPAGKKARVYGIAEVGVFFVSEDVATTTILRPTSFTTFTISRQASTDFSFAPGVGVEIALGSGNSSVDISARYDGVTHGAGDAIGGSIGGRIGVNFGVGK